MPRKNLFTPLGITSYHWKNSRSKIPDAEGGLYLTASDLARIGLLYLNNGKWKDAQIVSEVTGRHVEKVNEAGWGYGYQWWRLDKGETVVWACLGFGGQYMIILPHYNCISVLYGWNIFENNHTDKLNDYIDTLINSIE
jgi:CubicO group peptidase (beta-lactamase class C family)